jgi:hypothetical protein
LLSGLFEGRVIYSADFTATRVDIALEVAADRLQGGAMHWSFAPRCEYGGFQKVQLLGVNHSKIWNPEDLSCRPE